MSRISSVSFKKIFSFFVVGLILFLSFRLNQLYQEYVQEKKILNQIINRLSADSRLAQVLVTDVNFNPITQEHTTTIKFLEYGADGKVLEPKYFTFTGNIIQFQSLVVRFDDIHVKTAHALKGKSAYLFWKVFILDGPRTQEYPIAQVNEIPQGYKIDNARNKFEQEIWQDFWQYALDHKKAISKGIKNAQIEAPGTKFILGVLYTLKIEHDGGIRIDASEIPEILKGEKILQ